MSVLYVYYNALSADKPATSTETALLVRSARALHQRVGGKLFNFWLWALEQFRPRLREWPLSTVLAYFRSHTCGKPIHK
ncbi:hypothetical protein Pelo_4609 [Pelomyxa schiedti]|nr:hypothetical protein Pelo_4609 [Pelomyxa schiedti]